MGVGLLGLDWWGGLAGALVWLVVRPLVGLGFCCFFLRVCLWGRGSGRRLSCSGDHQRPINNPLQMQVRKMGWSPLVGAAGLRARDCSYLPPVIAVFCWWPGRCLGLVKLDWVCGVFREGLGELVGFCFGLVWPSWCISIGGSSALAYVLPSVWCIPWCISKP